MEDYRTYTVQDPINCLLVSPNKITAQGLTRDSSVYVLKDFGVEYFGDFTHYFRARISSASVGAGALAHVWILANNIGDGEIANGLHLLLYRGLDQWNMLLGEGVGWCDYNRQIIQIQPDTDYYITLRRLGQDLTCEIYGNPERTNLVATMNITVALTKYRYLYAIASNNSAMVGFLFNGEVGDLALEALPEIGILRVYAYEVGVQVAAEATIVGVGTYTTPFSIELKPDSYTLVVSYGIYSPQTRDITIFVGTTRTETFRFGIYPGRKLYVEGRYLKDETGRRILLRGVNKTGFEDYPWGLWGGSFAWSEAKVKAELDAMRSWGLNVIRLHQAVDNWKYDLSGHQQHIKDLITWAGERGLYVIYDGFCVVSSANGGGAQDPLPYPPYQKNVGSGVIASIDDFVAWWASVASELKDYPNVIFELWNEPDAPSGYDLATVRDEWYDAAQRSINMIRATGASQPIILQWRTGLWVNLSYPPPANPAGTLDWILDCPVFDPLGSLIYSTHVYRFYGGFGMVYTDAGFDHFGYTPEEIMQAFDYEKVRYIGEVLNKPLILGEVGANLNVADLDNELEAFRYALNLFNEWDISYVGFWWRETGVFRLIRDAVSFQPTASGQILIDSIPYAPPPPPTPMPSLLPLATIGIGLGAVIGAVISPEGRK